jgi:hypothetical protein
MVADRCTGAAGHVHHRKLRRFGDHTPINLLDVCLFCHDHIHRYVKWSYDHGYLVRSHGDPASIPVGGLAA